MKNLVLAGLFAAAVFVMLAALGVKTKGVTCEHCGGVFSNVTPKTCPDCDKPVHEGCLSRRCPGRLVFRVR